MKTETQTATKPLAGEVAKVLSEEHIPKEIDWNAFDLTEYMNKFLFAVEKHTGKRYPLLNSELYVLRRLMGQNISPRLFVLLVTERLMEPFTNKENYAEVYLQVLKEAHIYFTAYFDGIRAHCKQEPERIINFPIDALLKKHKDALLLLAGENTLEQVAIKQKCVLIIGVDNFNCAEVKVSSREVVDLTNDIRCTVTQTLNSSLKEGFSFYKNKDTKVFDVR